MDAGHGQPLWAGQWANPNGGRTKEGGKAKKNKGDRPPKKKGKSKKKRRGKNPRMGSGNQAKT